MKRYSFVRGLLAATTLATGLLLLGSASASAQVATGSTVTTKILPPVFGKVQITCGDADAGVSAKLYNPNATLQHYMVGITGGEIHFDYVVSPPGRGSELVEFGVPNGTYLLRAQNADGDFVASRRVRVQCDATPPTSTPTATPTGTPTGTPTATPTGTPTGTPTTSPTGTPPVTAVPSTPVEVPTAVEAGLLAPVAQDDSGHRRTIIGAGLLAAVGIMIGIASLLVRRRRGLHQL